MYAARMHLQPTQTIIIILTQKKKKATSLFFILVLSRALCDGFLYERSYMNPNHLGSRDLAGARPPPNGGTC